MFWRRLKEEEEEEEVVEEKIRRNVKNEPFVTSFCVICHLFSETANGPYVFISGTAGVAVSLVNEPSE